MFFYLDGKRQPGKTPAFGKIIGENQLGVLSAPVVKFKYSCYPVGYGWTYTDLFIQQKNIIKFNFRVNGNVFS